MKIFILALFLFSFSAHSAYSNYFEFCPETNYSKKNLEYIFLDHEEGINFNCNTLKKRIDTIENLIQISPITLPKLSLNIIEIGWDASNLIHMLNIPQNFERSNNGKSYFLNDKLTEAYLAHEFGHSIFIEYLAKDFPEFKFATDEIIENNKLAHKVKHLYSTNHIHSADALAEEVGEKEMNTFLSSKIMSPIRHVIAMSELFSDLVSVLYLEDHQAFSKAASGQHPTKSDIEENLPRDFSNDISINNWNESEAHILYAPVRSYIGNKLVFPMNLDTKKEILEKLLKIMSKELIMTYPGTTQESVQDLNLRLISKLELSNFLK